MRAENVYSESFSPDKSQLCTVSSGLNRRKDVVVRREPYGRGAFEGAG
jgi:hypothetical protein